MSFENKLLIITTKIISIINIPTIVIISFLSIISHLRELNNILHTLINLLCFYKHFGVVFINIFIIVNMSYCITVHIIVYTYYNIIA